MISTLIRYCIYEVGINVLFENITSNFTTAIKHENYLDEYWVVFDTEDDTILCYGLCKRQDGNLITLYDGYDEHTIHTNLYNITKMCSTYFQLIKLYDETPKEYISRLNAYK